MYEIRPRSTLRRSAGSALLAALALVFTTAGTSHAQQAAKETPHPSAGVEQSARTPASATETSPFPQNAAKHCVPTKAGSKERRAGAVEACVSTSPTKTRNRTGATIAAAGNCSLTPGTYVYGRFSYCVSGVNVLYTLIDSNGVPVGSGTLEVSTSATLPKAGTTWSEQVTTTMTAASGQVTTLNAKFRAACGSGCTATKTAPWYGGDLTVGQSVTGSVTYSSAPATGAVARFVTSYKMYVTSPGTIAVDPNASWDNPREIRCDNAVGGSSAAGCAVPSVMPVVPMSATAGDPGGAVATYGWAQKNLDGAWGTKGHPLTRSTNGAAARTAATCGSFTAQPEIVESDTCGDFPFGEAKEGGAAGDRCVEVIPNLGNGEWDSYVFNDSRDMDPASPCVQAHVTPAEKQFADTQLTDGFADQRVIDADQFELPVSTPETGPQASCLNDPPPAGAIPNGDGWFKNTKEPVPLVNQTDPAGGAGERPTRAQACLGRQTGTGTGTSGTITGWKDAEAFRTAQGVTHSLARCHLIASVLGGKGTSAATRFNLVPCWQVGMNTGTPSMRTYESMTQNMIKDPASGLGADDAVFYQVTPVYQNADSTIPVGVTMSADIQRAGGSTEELFPSVYVPNTQDDTLNLNLGN